jgi:hypothetical protein
MRKKRRILFLILVSVGYTLVGCQPPPPKPTLFDTSPCKAPCWQNVTPGLTSEQDAMLIFDKFADKGPYPRFDKIPGYEDIYWFDTSDENSIFVYILDGKISEMDFQGYFDSPITLQHAIELFGEPESVLVEDAPERYEVRLFNLTKGIAFGWPGPGISKYGEINPDTEVGMVWFFDPSQSDLFLNAKYLGSGIGIKKQFRPWNGYGKINDKYWPPATP